jgi:hypothetical protein
VKDQAVLNYLRERARQKKNFPKVITNRGRNKYYYNIRALHNYNTDPNGPGIPSGKYRLISRHNSSAKGAPANMKNKERAILKAIKKFTLQRSRRVFENLERNRVLSRANSAGGAAATVFSIPNLRRLIYSAGTKRSHNANIRHVNAAKRLAQRYNKEVDRLLL